MRAAGRRGFYIGALAALGAALPGPASGQSTAPPAQLLRSPLASVTQAGSGVADGAEPWAVVLNPASLGDLTSWTLGLRDTETDSDNHFFGRGSGIYFARPLPLIRRFKLGAGLELLRSPLGGPEFAGKLTLSLAYKIFAPLSLGLSYAHLFANPTAPSYDGLNTVSLGARLRLGRYLAVGVVLHDLSAPQPSAPQLPSVQRSFEGEVLLRPLGDERWELAGAARGSEQTQELWTQLRLWVRPTRGLALGAQGAVLYTPGAASLGYWFGGGVQLDFASVGFSAFGWGGNRPTSTDPRETAWLGGSVALRISGERYPAVWSGPRRLYKIEIGQKTGLAQLQLLALLRQLERDPRAQGVLVVISGVSGGWGVADELRAALVRLRAAGKRVIAYAADLSTREYYIASAAEHIFLDPVGSVRLQGVAQGGFFLKNALDRVGIRADLVRIGDYKSSPEMWTRSEPSAPAVAQRQMVVDDIGSRLRSAVADGRKLPLARIDQLVERGLFIPESALAEHLIDSVASAEQVESQLETLLGGQVALGLVPAPSRPRSWASPVVAVIHVDGDIAEGKSRTVPLLELKTVGGETLTQALSEAERDSQVKAVVIRVDSPGGSALWADLLSRQVSQLARFKPVVCSFGDLAASGGYYLAAGCGEIFTNPSTITGSIGIYGGKVDVSGLLELLSARRVSVQNGAHADMDGPFRPYSDAERALIGERLQKGYDRFVATVASGRHLSFGEVDAVARGRIWTGAQAVSRKLCDKSGGLADAIAAARARAGLPGKAGYGDDELRFLPRPQPGLLGKLLGIAPDLLSGSAQAGADAAELLPGLSKLLGSVSGLISPLGAALLLTRDPVLMRLDSDLGELGR